jgi:type IV fimbrial biogenesis protein FimT
MLIPVHTEKIPSNVRSSHEFGFTLIEMMVVIAIIAIVSAFAIPSYQSIMASSRMRATVSDFSQSLALARLEAQRRNSIVSVCPSTNGSSCTGGTQYEVGWLVKVGLPADAGTLLQDHPGDSRLTMTVKGASGKNFTFMPNGTTTGNFFGAFITILDARTQDLSNGRYLCIAKTGRVRVFRNDQYLALNGNDGCSN